ncbi:hypothetical protein BSLG_002130 [Batrachochytrium salamandrivorans]|nr:hypothetical protein BSLG_002130 [Batrachochytrium salamandrivorans]
MAVDHCIYSIRDDQLASALGINNKDLQKVCGILRVQGMLKVETRWEEVVLKERPDAQPHTKAFRDKLKRSKSYYYIDYRHFVNVVKFKIYKIGKMIEKEVEAEITQMPYKCPLCTKEFSALDMLSLERTSDSMPLCDICGSEVQLDESTGSKNSSATYTRFMNESRPIVELLKQTDKIVIPDSKPVLPDPGATNQPREQTGPVIKESSGLSGPQIVVELENCGEDSAGSQGVKTEAQDDDMESKDLQEYYSNLAKMASGYATEINESTGVTEGAMDDDDEDEDFEAVPPVMNLTSVVTSQKRSAVSDDDDDDDEDFTEV